MALSVTMSDSPTDFGCLCSSSNSKKRIQLQPHSKCPSVVSIASKGRGQRTREKCLASQQHREKVPKEKKTESKIRY